MNDLEIAGVITLLIFLVVCCVTFVWQWMSATLDRDIDEEDEL